LPDDAVVRHDFVSVLKEVYIVVRDTSHRGKAGMEPRNDGVVKMAEEVVEDMRIVEAASNPCVAVLVYQKASCAVWLLL
jgi:hypothetical protein